MQNQKKNGDGDTEKMEMLNTGRGREDDAGCLRNTGAA